METTHTAATTTEVIGFTVLGTSDEISACDCCGRTGLKATVAIQFDDADEPVYYGRTCAARYARVKVSVIDRGIKSAAEAAYEAEEAARKVRRDAADAVWTEFVITTAGITTYHLALDALGGYAAATAAFKAR